MSMSTFQKVTVVSCVCVCVALLLPKLLLSGGGGGGGRRDPGSAEGARFPPVMQRRSVSAPPRGAGGNSAHHTEAIARAKGGTATTGKSNLAGQIIPVYGFGILLYILYIIFKITSRGKESKPQESRFPAVRSENMKRKITDFELTQLQERLKETEEVMERIVSRARSQTGNTLREECVSVDQEEKLLLQLREITRVMQEGQLVDGVHSETLQQECDQEFTDNPEEILKHWSSHCCSVHHQQQEETERADRQVEEERVRADRQVEEERDKSAERQEETERAHSQVEDQVRADSQVEEDKTERAHRKVEDQVREDRQVEEEKTERAHRKVEDQVRADRQMEEEDMERADRHVEQQERTDRQVEVRKRTESEMEEMERANEHVEESRDASDGEEMRSTEMMEQSEQLSRNILLPGRRVIRRRRRTKRGTESSHCS